jgi:carboxylesterase type B
MNSSLPLFAGTTTDNTAIVTSFQPSVDGKIIPADPATVGTQVPALFGTSKYSTYCCRCELTVYQATMEGTLFILAGYTFPPSTQNYSSFLTTNFGSYAPVINSTYSLAKFNSTPYPAFYAMVEVFTDYNYLCPLYRALLNANKRNVPVWTYSWGQEPTCPWYAPIGSNPTILKLLNATHTSELPFVFANTDNLPLPNGTCSLNAFEKQLSADVVAAWTSMAANGNPNGDGGIFWPAFSANTSAGLIVGNGSVNTGALDFSVCQFWDTIQLGVFTNTTTATNTSNGSSGTSTTSSSPGATSSHSGGSQVRPFVLTFILPIMVGVLSSSSLLG